MQTFYMFLTLSSLTAPQMLFISQPHPWKDEFACEQALPKMEAAVTRLIRFDVSTLDLFGTTTGGPVKPDYFVTVAECRPEEPGP